MSATITCRSCGATFADEPAFSKHAPQPVDFVARGLRCIRAEALASAGLAQDSVGTWHCAENDAAFPSDAAGQARLCQRCWAIFADTDAFAAHRGSAADNMWRCLPHQEFASIGLVKGEWGWFYLTEAAGPHAKEAT